MTPGQKLRTAVDKPFDQPIIKTVHGVGFSLDIPDEISHES